MQIYFGYRNGTVHPILYLFRLMLLCIIISFIVCITGVFNSLLDATVSTRLFPAPGYADT